MSQFVQRSVRISLEMVEMPRYDLENPSWAVLDLEPKPVPYEKE